jgi:hypothetical protein
MAVWKVWFDNGTCSTGKTKEEWEALPRHGVLIVKEFFEDETSMYHMGLDYYFYEEGCIKSCNRNDIDRYLERPQGLQCVKFGRWGDTYTWEAAKKEARKPCCDD